MFADLGAARANLLVEPQPSPYDSLPSSQATTLVLGAGFADDNDNVGETDDSGDEEDSQESP